MKRTTFANIDDELNWYAFVMSEGNLEAAQEFVKERNKQRELDVKQKKENAKKQNTGTKERNV